MSAAASIAVLWIAFGASHMLLSSLRFRPRLVQRLGERAFLGLYSGIAFALFIPLVWIYVTHKHAGPWLWGPVVLGGGLRWTLYVVVGAALVLVVSSFVKPSAAAMGSPETEPHGATRLTRHPQNMGIALFGLTHLVPNAALSDVAFFGGFVLWALLGSWHQDQRRLANQESYRAFRERTPFLPFTGRETLQGLRELSPVALALGIAATVGLRLFHGTLFGP